MSFDAAFAIVVGVEGGYANDPADPGGETKYGISKRAYPNEDIANLTLERAKELYQRDYWTPIKGGVLPWPFVLFVFDAAVNQGVEPAIKMAQRAFDIPQDGLIGPRTIEAAQNATPWHVARFMAFRAQRYASTRNYDKYGAGWMTRLFQLAMHSI